PARLRAAAPADPGRPARARGAALVRSRSPERSPWVRARGRAPTGALRSTRRTERRRTRGASAGERSGRGAERGPIGAVNPAAVSEQLARPARAHPHDAAALARFARLLADTAAPFSRDQYDPGHITCSACVLDSQGARVLLLHHARLARWLQPGGHAEP